MSRRLNERGSTLAERQAAAEVVAALSRKRKKPVPKWVVALTTTGTEESTKFRADESNAHNEGRATPNASEEVQSQQSPAYSGATVGDRALESVIATIAADLGVEVASVNGDFFKLGANALFAARLARRLNEILGTSIETPTIFQAPTVRRLAARLAATDEPKRLTETDEPKRLTETDEPKRLTETDEADVESELSAGDIELGPVVTAFDGEASSGVVIQAEQLRAKWVLLVTVGGQPRAWLPLETVKNSRMIFSDYLQDQLVPVTVVERSTTLEDVVEELLATSYRLEVVVVVDSEGVALGVLNMPLVVGALAKIGAARRRPDTTLPATKIRSSGR